MHSTKKPQFPEDSPEVVGCRYQGRMDLIAKEPFEVTSPKLPIMFHVTDPWFDGLSSSQGAF
ncbi:MAG: hypothetical protein A3C42_06165 [Chlamydiae bacterium RIFCSPHIGHO2_02_FULL_45_9]|nr:MAG: hypothetical protein A3C42_06165 [Chlamydiae bacterium RIFCSPHIGHO2_02_FULL_45_9]